MNATGRAIAALRSFGRARIGTFRLLVLLRLVQWPIRGVTRPVLRRIPREPSLIAFGAASERFADNPAYSFLALVASPSLRCVWISGSAATVERLRAAGLPAERRWSRRGVAVALRAGWYVYGWNPADVNRWLGDGARTLNLWHGVGIKRVQRARIGVGPTVYDAPDGSFLAAVLADDRHVPDLVLSSSPGMTPVLAEAFGVPPERCVELGYPRNDHLVDATPAPAALVDPALLERLRGQRVVGYFPTFRDDSMGIPGGAPVIEEVAEVVGAQGATLLFKAHDASHVEVGRGSNLVVLPADADLNAYLGCCDVLVTDYSSVASDFLLLRDRPIVLFVPDVDDFEAVRGFALDPKDKLPGLVTRTTAELHQALGDLARLPAPDPDGRLLAFYWGDGRGGASTRLRELLEPAAR
jgi:CDP-glycerol glycerophosphotransferase (TagB/SpsB family)